MITESRGNLLAAEADALVNTVNTEGVMGKGIALQFKRAYPEMFEAYARAAKSGELALGRVHVWSTGSLDGPRFVLNFPTKGHWRSRSRLTDVDTGLADLVRLVRELGIRSVAVPPLGCGNGGLAWADVEPRIRAAFADVPDVEVLLFAPGDVPLAGEMHTATATPPMTLGRAALVHLLQQYQRHALEASLIEVQKLMYFLQVSGEPLRLNFAKGAYGPYADNLRHVLSIVEGHYLTGFGDGSSAPLEAEPIRVLPGADDAARRELDPAPATRERIARVLDLAAGFESMYGMELLGSVHWVCIQDDPAAALDATRATDLVGAWNRRKASTFTLPHVTAALDALRGGGWLPELTTSSDAPA